MLKWIMALFITLPAWAFKLTPDFLNGFYWAELPIKITVIDSDPSRKQLLHDLAYAAIDEWESRTGLALWDYTDSASASGNNIIRWSKKFGEETNMDPASVLAVAIRYTNGPYFAKTEIVINGNHELNKYEQHLRTTLTHELGHTMGLDHSEVGDAVMAPTLQSIYYGLHEDDVMGMTEAHSETQRRQTTGYISPLSFEVEEKEAATCGTVGPVTAQSGTGNGISLAAGILIGFVRKIFKWLRSLF